MMPRGILFAILACALGDGRDAAATAARVALSDAALRPQGDVLLRHGVPFSGTLVQESSGELRAEVAYVDGKRHGRARAWYPGGALAHEKLFEHGDRAGIHRGFWPNGRLQFEYRYEHDLFEGEQVSYHANGSRAELRHYVAGHEEGRQTTWDPEGRVASNYTFKGGKRYGIVGRSDCVSVHEK